MKLPSFFAVPAAAQGGIHASGSAKGRARSPGIDDIFPDLWADSTHGEMEMHKWARGHHTVFFAHPSAYTLTSEADVIGFARLQDEFDARNCHILGMTQSDPLTERMWVEEISAKHGVEVRFPIISDEDGRIASALGMFHENTASDLPVCKTFIISPDLRIRTIMEFPTIVPRSASEILRIVDVLRKARR